MFKHVVMFQFVDPSPAHLHRAAEALRGLLGVVPTLRSLEVGLDSTRSERCWDLCLTTAFDDRAGMDAYAVHPAHMEVVGLLRTLTKGAAVVDYEG